MVARRLAMTAFSDAVAKSSDSVASKLAPTKKAGVTLCAMIELAHKAHGRHQIFDWIDSNMRSTCAR